MALNVNMWRYSVRWGLRHQPCPGEEELGSQDVSAGEQCPAPLRALWRPGSGYAICLDFFQGEIKRWPPERKGAVRQKRLEKYLQKHAPLFFQELLERELNGNADYYQGRTHLRRRL